MAGRSLNDSPSGDRRRGGLAVKNLTRHPMPRLPFERAAGAVLPGWDLSLVFVGETRARFLNRTLRKKEYVPNVLSYGLAARSGEIIICPSAAEKEASAYGHSALVHCLYLFIHGLLHLKGMAHGVTMERRERALLARTLSSSSLARLPLPNETTHRNRHRHRNIPGKAGRRRRGR